MEKQIEKETLDKERAEQEQLDEIEFCCECGDRLVFWSETLQSWIHWEEEEIGCGLHAGIETVPLKK